MDAASKKQRLSKIRILPAAQITLGVILLGCLAASWWAWSQFVIGTQNTQLTNTIEKITTEKAELIRNLVVRTQGQLDQLATTPSLQQAVETSNDPASTQANKSRVNTLVGSTFNDLVSIKLIDNSRKNLLQETDQLSFIELDMVNRAERFHDVPPELIPQGEKQNFTFVASIGRTAEDKASAILMVNLPLTRLTDLLNRSDQGYGKVRILQKIKRGNPIELLSLGQGKQSTPHMVHVDNTNWHLEFTASEQLINSTRVSIIPTLGVCVVGTLLILALTGFILKMLGLVEIASDSADNANLRHTDVRPGQGSKSKIVEDILDIDLAEEDKQLQGLDDALSSALPILEETDSSSTLPAREPVDCPLSIFRAYDIRGLVESEITSELTYHIGLAIGSETLHQGQHTLFVARDGRNHSAAIAQQLIAGINDSGCHVIDLGAVPTPLLYFACATDEHVNSGVVVTASHNPADYNGFKIVINGKTLAGEDIQAIRQRIIKSDLSTGAGSLETRNIVDAYIERIFSDVALAGTAKLVIDAGNGISGEIAPRLFEELGCEVIPLYCDVDGTFPNHEADPSVVANLADLIAKVKETGADLGLAFDGDGDRIGVVTNSGEIILPDRLLMLFAKDIVTGNPGCDVLYDVKCSRELSTLINSYGGRPIMSKTGHSNMKAKMQETGALLGGELSGHIFIKDRWYGFDDGMYAGARLLEIMTLRDQSLDDIFTSFPVLPNTPEIKITVDDAVKFSLIESLATQGQFEGGNITTIDGLRIDFAHGWGLVRASNTSPALTLRFEGETEAQVTKIQQLFRQELLKVDPDLSIPF